MRDEKLGKTVRLALAPLACATLLAACAPYEPYNPGGYSSAPVYDNPSALFDRLDANRDGFLSRAEVGPLGIVSTAPAPIESAQAMFDRLDTNRDGFLSPAEAGNVFAPVPGGSFVGFDTNRDGFLSRAEAMPHLQWLENRYANSGPNFDAYDANRDGFLSRAEADPLLRDTRMIGGRYVVGAITTGTFDRWDANRDGFLSRSEAAQAVGPGMFERYDANRDGFLSRSEAEPLFGTGVGSTTGAYGGSVTGPRY